MCQLSINFSVHIILKISYGCRLSAVYNKRLKKSSIAALLLLGNVRGTTMVIVTDVGDNFEMLMTEKQPCKIWHISFVYATLQTFEFQYLHEMGEYE